MNKVKSIPHPELKNAEVLSPLQLNKLPYRKKHTLLTPDRLEKMARGDDTILK